MSESLSTGWSFSKMSMPSPKVSNVPLLSRPSVVKQALLPTMTPEQKKREVLQTVMNSLLFGSGLGLAGRALGEVGAVTAPKLPPVTLTSSIPTVLPIENPGDPREEKTKRAAIGQSGGLCSAKPRATTTFNDMQLIGMGGNRMPKVTAPAPKPLVPKPAPVGTLAQKSAAEAAYGYCPICGGPGEVRERRPNGNDHCKAGHVYPSRQAVDEPAAQKRADILPRFVQDSIKSLPSYEQVLGSAAKAMPEVTTDLPSQAWWGGPMRLGAMGLGAAGTYTVTDKLLKTLKKREQAERLAKAQKEYDAAVVGKSASNRAAIAAEYAAVLQDPTSPVHQLAQKVAAADWASWANNSGQSLASAYLAMLGASTAMGGYKGFQRARKTTGPSALVRQALALRAAQRAAPQAPIALLSTDDNPQDQ